MCETSPVTAQNAEAPERPARPNSVRGFRSGSRGTDLLLVGVVLSSLLGRFSISVGEASVRPEHVATVALLVWMLFSPDRRAALFGRLRDPLVLLLGSWVAIGIVSTALFAPSRSASLPITVWLCADVVLLACLLALVDRMGVVELAGVAVVLPWAALGVVAVALAAEGMSNWGVQFDTVFGVYAAYATAYEANVFASFVAAWALVLVWRSGPSLLLSISAAIVVPLAILAAQTRASLVGLTCGLLAMIVMTWRSWWRAPAWWRMLRAPAFMLVGLAVVILVGPVKSFGHITPAVPFASSPTPTSSSSPTPAYSSPSPSPQRAETPRTTPSAGPSLTPTPAPSTGSSLLLPERPDKLTHFGFGDNFEYRRLVTATALTDMSGARWVVGNGINTFGQRHDDPTLVGVPGYISSLPVQLLYDTGIAGVAVFVAFIVVVLRRVPPQRRSLAVPLLIALGITMSFTSSLWFSTTWLLIAILVRPTLRTFNMPKDRARPPLRSQPPG